MKKNWNTWKCRLTAWIMALLVLLGTVPQDAAVLAAEGSAQAAQQQTITGFAGLSGEQSEIHITGRVSEDRLLAKMPESLEVYLNGSSEPTSIPVTWHSIGDYEGTNYYSYGYTPQWDTDTYILGAGLSDEIPYVAVFIKPVSNFKGASISSSQMAANEKTIYNFLKKELKLNTAAACGVLANIQSESAFNPTASVIDTNGKTSYGICQWNGPRFEMLKDYCSQYGYDYRTLEGQLYFLKYELEHTEASAFSKVKNVDNTADGAYTAGYNWARYFERCASVYHEWRAKLARDTYWPKYVSDSIAEDKTTYQITYELYGGKNNSANPNTYKASTSTITLKEPTKKGYTFQGWYKESSMKTKVSSIPYGSSGNLKLYAKWEANQYTIQFNGNKATSGSMSAMKSREYDSSYRLSANKYKRKGYQFAGWNTKADGSGKAYANREEVENLSSKDGAKLTLYAQWTRESYKITYKTNGGKLSSGTTKKYHVNTKTFTLKNPVRTGYTFEGWYKDSKFKNKITQVKKGSTGNLTLYAKWSINTYKIKYQGNGATSGSMKRTLTCKYGNTYTLAKNKFKRTGYVFEGWNTRKDGTGDWYEDRADIKNISKRDGKTITLYAQWSKKPYTISYALNGGTMTKSNRSTYYVDTKTFTLKAPEREGYTFEGWYTEKDFKHKITRIKKGTRKNYKLYAKWKVNSYEIQFDGNGADSGNMETLKNCKYGSTYTLPGNGFQKAGYQFIGWSTQPDGSDSFYGDMAEVTNLSFENGASVTLYAQWETE